MAPETQPSTQILVIAADTALRDQLIYCLQKEVYAVQGISDVGQAPDLLHRHPPDLLLLDAAAAGPFAEYRRHQLALAATPLVVLGPAEPGAEADACLPVPVPPEQLLAVVRQFLPRPKPAILVVEDDPSIRRMFQVALESAGFVVSLAAAGPEAIDLLQQNRDAISLTLLDVQLGGPLDGPQTLAALRRIRPDLRCCFMSGDPGVYSREQLLALGAGHVFPKPFPSLAEVVRLLWRMIPPRPAQ